MRRYRRLVSLICTFVIILSLMPLQAAAAGPTLKEGAVYRTSAADATVRFLSDSDGTYYYKVTDNATFPDPNDLTTWEKGDAVTADTITAVTLTGMASGPRCVHIVVKDAAEKVSDVLTVSMPYDLYYSENFETYAEGNYPDHFSRQYNGAGYNEQKVINSTQAGGESGKVFRLKGSYNNASDSRADLPAGITGTVVYEADIKPVSEVPGGLQLGRKGGGGWVDAVVRVALANGTLHWMTGDGPGVLTDVTYDIGKWYTLRVELNYTNRTFDYYLDGVKLNANPLQAHYTRVLNRCRCSLSVLSFR